MFTSLLLSSLLTIPTVFGQGGAGGGVQYAGVNIPGMEFGCDTDVSFPTGFIDARGLQTSSQSLTFDSESRHTQAYSET